MLTLSIVLPNGKSTTRRLSTGSYIVGRGLTADVRIGDKAIARQHAIVDVFPDRQQVRSAGRDCEMSIDDQPTHAYGPLRAGDVLTLGNSRIEVVDSSVAPLHTAVGQVGGGSRQPVAAMDGTVDSRVDGIPMGWSTDPAGNGFDGVADPPGQAAHLPDTRSSDPSPSTETRLPDESTLPDTGLADELTLSKTRLPEEAAPPALALSRPVAVTPAEREAAQRYAELTPLRKAIQEQVQTQLDLHKRNQISDMSSGRAA